MHQPSAGGAGGQLPAGIIADAVHKAAQRLPHILAVQLLGYAVLHGAQPVEPLLLLLPGHRVGQLGRRRAGTGRENKGEQRVKAHLFHQRHRLHGLGLRFAGEADDHVAGEHQLRHHPPGVGDQLQILFHIIGAVHGAEHPVAAGLHRQVQLPGHMAAGSHHVEQLVAGVLRLGGHKADKVVALDLIQRRQQVGKVVADAQILAVGVDVLPQQGDLLEALGHKAAHLIDDPLRVAAALPAPDVGHDAVGTEVVAAVHDGHPRAGASLPHHGHALGDGAVFIRHGWV